MRIEFYKILTVFALGTMAVISACTKESDPIKFDPQYGKEYFPTVPQSYRDYRVDSAYYNTVVGTDTVFSRFYLREVVGAVFNTGSGDTSYYLNQYIKQDSAQPWPGTTTRNYSLTALQEGVIRVEENVPILALRYPFRIGSTWNGNQYNSLATQSQEFKAYGFSTMNVVGRSIDSVLTVVEKRDSSCLDKSDIFTRYARGIGVVERYRNIFEFVQDPVNPCAEPVVVRRVNRYRQKLIGYGKL